MTHELFVTDENDVAPFQVIFRTFQYVVTSGVEAPNGVGACWAAS